MIVRIVQLGRSGHRFKYPAYARHKGNSSIRDQVGLKIMVVDQRDFAVMDRSYDMNRNDFCAPQQHIVQATDEEAALAEALFALNDGKIFVKPVNEVSEGEEG